MRGDQGGKRGGSGPRQRSAAGHETWLLLGLGTWILSRLTIQGSAVQSRGFVPLSLPYPGVRICPVGLKRGEFKTSIGKLSRGLTSFGF